MAVIRMQRLIATVSWIDPASGLPEVDMNKPMDDTTTRAFLTGNKRYRFCNFMEVWADWDSNRKQYTNHGFMPASGLYRAPSFWGIEPYLFPVQQQAKREGQTLTLTQIVGARTVSPEVIGKRVGQWTGVFSPLNPAFLLGPIGGFLVGGDAGEAAAHAITAFPPIWSMLLFQFAVDNRGGPISRGFLRTHSYFPSLTFYQVVEHAPAGTPLALAKPTDSYLRSNVTSGAPYYNGVPNLNLWKDQGWGPVRSWNAGPALGNPWNYNK